MEIVVRERALDDYLQLMYKVKGDKIYPDSLTIYQAEVLAWLDTYKWARGLSPTERPPEKTIRNHIAFDEWFHAYMDKMEKEFIEMELKKKQQRPDVHIEPVVKG